VGDGVLHEALWQWVQATDSLDCFSHEQGNLTRCVEVDCFLKLIGIFLWGLFCREWSSEEVREASSFNSLSLGDVMVPRANVCEMLCSTMSMVAILQGQNGVVAGVHPCELGCQGVSLGAA
jgi:hypothetical protein